MSTENKKESRRKFLGWGLATAAVLSVAKIVLPSNKESKKTVKMLTQDGKLVEVDIAALPPQKKKITNQELQNWIGK
ncbi:MAG: hypothetical protein ABIU77_02870 [Ferruginibacter sp.]|jgi:hypothetical protein